MQRDLVVQAKGGDAEAFSSLAERAIGRLHAVAYGILRDADAADDATQRALIDAWDHIGGLRDPDRFDAWTYRLVIHEAYRELRHARSQRERVRLIGADPSSSDATDPSVGVVERAAIEAAFNELSPDHRAVLVLHHVVDLPLADIAAILQVPVGTVGSRLYHAARHLRAALDPESGTVLAAEPAR